MKILMKILALKNIMMMTLIMMKVIIMQITMMTLMMTTWRRDCATPIPEPWIQEDLGISRACSSFPQSDEDNACHDEDYWWSVVKLGLVLVIY